MATMREKSKKSLQKLFVEWIALIIIEPCESCEADKLYYSFFNVNNIISRKVSSVVLL